MRVARIWAYRSVIILLMVPLIIVHLVRRACAAPVWAVLDAADDVREHWR